MLLLKDAHLTSVITNNIDNCQLDLATHLRLSIIRDLVRVGWKIEFCNRDIEIKIVPPSSYNKEAIRKSISHKRIEYLKNNNDFVKANIVLARENLASGYDVLDSKIKPIIEVCETPQQHRLFKILRCYWSSPFSEYVGRRIKIIIRDGGLPAKPVIGIAALGSPIIHIPERDKYIGWDKDTRTERINYTMDAYVIGALPPYNMLLGGKLISYLLASKEVRKIYQQKYQDKVTIISGQKRDKLVGIFTTSLFGNSSQYNRIKFHNHSLYNLIGQTKGMGTHHLSYESIELMSQYLKNQGVIISHKFGDGPNFVMRLIRYTGELLGFDGDILLSHSFKRNIYFIPLAENSLEFLRGESNSPKYYNWTINQLVDYWKKRWLEMRMLNKEIIDEVKWFSPETFEID